MRVYVCVSPETVFLNFFSPPCTHTPVQVGGYITGMALLILGAYAAIFGLDLLATC